MRSVLRLYAVLRTSLAALLLAKLQPQFAAAASVCPQEQAIRPCKCSERSNEIQIWCSYGDLNSIMNSLKVVGQMVPKTVDELILENNLLPSLPGQMFSSLKILRLMLRENGLQRVSANWLSGSESTLQEIYVVEPELRSFPEESLITLPKLEALTLSAGLLTKMPAIFGLSRLRYIQIEASAMSDVAPNNFQGLPFLEQLHITSAPKLRRLDEDFVHDLPKLSILNFTQCGLTYIHPRALVRLPSLTEISFSGNRFIDARMVGMAIRDLPNLATVRLDGNSINRLEEGTFVDIPSLTNLYLNDNKIIHIFRAAFHRLPRLRSLDLSNNEIRVIHPEGFLPFRDNIVEELWLNNNHIEHSFILKILVDSLPNLRLLDMSNNYLEDLSQGIVQNHLSLEMLILENNKLLKLGRESFVGLPSLRELKLRNNSLAYHLGTPYWNLPALKGLDLSRNNFEHIDRYLLSGLPSLRRIDISHNLLKTVDPATFMGSPFLEHINVSRNDIQLLSPLTFSQLHRLFDLDISHNNLSQGISGIPRNVEYLYMSNNNMMVITTATMHEFQLSSLKLLDLSGNKIHKIPGTSLSALCTLRTLLLNDNSLQVIDQSVFENLPQLRILQLANNKLIVIKKNTFKKLLHLNELNLGKNRLEVFEPEILSNNTELKKLDLSGNRLTDLASNVFASNKKIEELNLSENSLTLFPSSITGMAALQTIDLSRNQLKIVPPNVLPTLPALKELHLSGNKLQELSYGVFEKLPHLAMLDVENNEIERIGMHAFHSLPNLVMVKLSKNKITTVAKSAFEDLPTLQSIELQENHLQDVANDAIVSCPNLLMLNLSNNALSGVEKAGLHGLKTLEALDLSHNKITRLSMDSVRDLNFLILLKLDNNRLCNIEGTPFEKMFRLRMLSLRDNKMTSLAENTFNKLRSSILYFDIEGNPVKCSCNMIWLQSWLQQDEQRHPGPRCSDGILLREHKISKHNCDDILETVPGCEVTTPATAPTINITMIPGPAQVQPASKPNSYLKPLPEESDYFDPKFIEYHENNSRPAAQNKTAIPASVMSHFIPGDTPTLYAGIKPKINATKPNVPPQSSSAFTFFGMPLPSLNLNNFWNSGKSADKSKKHGRHESWPPTEPEIQKDGFVPVLPGIGGFVPMNVSIADTKNSTPHHVTGHATIAKVALPQKEIVNSEDFFDVEPTARPNRNVSRHKETFVQISTPSTTQVAPNRSESTTRKSEPTKTFVNEPVFSISDRFHGDPDFDDDKSFEKSFVNKTAIREKPSEEFTSPSSISEVVIPSGEISTSSTGRPIISKVHLNPGPSPHTEDPYSSHLRLAKSSLHSSTTTHPTTTTSKSKNDSSRNESNWYFANYNRSNIEPFVGRLPIKTSINSTYQNRPLLPLFYTWLLLFVIF